MHCNVTFLSTSSSVKALEPNDFFTDMPAFFNSIVSNSYYGMFMAQNHTNLPPEHPIIATRHNGIQDGPCIGKKVYSFANWRKFTFSQGSHLYQLRINPDLKACRYITKHRDSLYCKCY